MLPHPVQNDRVLALDRGAGNESSPAGERASRCRDAKSTGKRIRRWLGHWAVLWTASFAVIFCIHVAAGSAGDSWALRFSATWGRCAVYAVLALLPGFVPDVVRLCERAIAPILRFGRALADLAAGNEVSPLPVDDQEYWTDLTRDFNAVVAKTQTPNNPPELIDLGLQSAAPLRYASMRKEQ